MAKPNLRDFSGQLTQEQRVKRRITVWDLKLRGWSDYEISEGLNVSVTTIRTDLSEQRKVMREASDWSTKDAMNQFLEQNNRVIRMAIERMEKEDTQEEDYATLVDSIVNMPTPPGSLRPSIPMPPRTSHAALIETVRKANQDFAMVTGLKKDNHSVTVTLLSNADLIKEALASGIDVTALGIPLDDEGRILLPEKAPIQDIIEGEYVSDTVLRS